MKRRPIRYKIITRVGLFPYRNRHRYNYFVTLEWTNVLLGAYTVHVRRSFRSYLVNRPRYQSVVFFFFSFVRNRTVNTLRLYGIVFTGVLKSRLR